MSHFTVMVIGDNIEEQLDPFNENIEVDEYEQGEVFDEEKTINTPGNVGLGHTRYSTAGMDDIESLKKNAQPEYLVNPFLAAVHNGNIINC